MRSCFQIARFSAVWFAVCFTATPATFGEGYDPLVGIWIVDEDFQTVEFLFRSDGRYQVDTKGTDPSSGISNTERGYYQVDGQALYLQPYDHFGEPQPTRYEFEVFGDSLRLDRPEFFLTQIAQLKPGSRADVLAKEQANSDLVGSWKRGIIFWGDEEYTFRPGGYYFRTDTPESGNFPPDIIRGRYEQNGDRLTITPYSGIAAEYETDFFGNTLTIIKRDESSAQSATYELVHGSKEVVLAKSAEAEAFLSRPTWHVGVWEIRNDVYTVDLTIRPDGYYSSTNDVEILRGMVRGRYTLEPRRIHFHPFIGQDIYSRDNGDFGKVDRTREIDYYDGELQLIELDALSQWVMLARKRPGSEEIVMQKAREAQEQRAREGWHVGIWEVNDPSGWMEFTFRPDNRYIAKSGTGGEPGQVERGRYVLRGDKITLAPYSGLGPARGFEFDLYDGDLFLVGDSHRMVIARKVPGSETEVIEKTLNPTAMKGERGSILGLWTANRPGENVELVFRPDGHFRLTRCSNDVISQDYGLYSVDMTTRTIVYDSRFVLVQNQGLDFYGDTMTIYGGLGAPSTYTVNLGVVDAAIQASLAADAAEAQVDAQWLARVPTGPRDPNAVHVPVGNIPADPNPGHIFDSPTVFSGYHLYRRLIPGFVYFNDGLTGSIKSVAVTHTREWHFFPTGRVLVRFQNYSAGSSYPNTIVTVSDSWGAYRIGPKPTETDILHVFADNTLFIETDLGEQMHMTLEDGRRNLFWGKDYQILSEWAAERKPVPCELPGNANASLINVAVSLSTTIEPDATEEPRQPSAITLTRTAAGNLTLSGDTDAPGTLVIQRTTSLVPPVAWEPFQTNSIPGGPFSLELPENGNPATFFRVSAQ